MFQGFKKATPYGGTRKLRLTPPSVCSVHNDFVTENRSKVYQDSKIYFEQNDFGQLETLSKVSFLMTQFWFGQLF